MQRSRSVWPLASLFHVPSQRPSIVFDGAGEAAAIFQSRWKEAQPLASTRHSAINHVDRCGVISEVIPGAGRSCNCARNPLGISANNETLPDGSDRIVALVRSR